MVILKTQSQIDNFLKRNLHKHNYRHYEGCGCCMSFSHIDVDKNKILVKKSGEYQGATYYNCEVIAIVKTHKP